MIWLIQSKTSSFFSANFWQCCQSCIQGVQMNSLWRKFTWEKILKLKKLQEVLWKIADIRRKVSGSFDKTAFYLLKVEFKENYHSCVKCCLVCFLGFWVKNCQVFWETVSARVYELLSTSTKQRRFCPFWCETFVFQSVCNFLKVCRVRINIFPVFVHWIFVRVFKAVFRCPEEHFMEKTNLKQPFSLEAFFRILNKKYSDFSQFFFGRFRKKRSTCPEEQSVESCESKKAMKQKKLWRFFWQIWDFDGKFPAVFSKLHSSCQATFWWKAAFASEILIGNIFLDIGRKLSRFWQKCFRSVVQTAF